VYSPNYFKMRGQRHNYCAREVFAFVRRHQPPHFEDVGGLRTIRAVKAIFPILWCGVSDLTKLGMPPPVLKYIHYSIPNVDNRAWVDKYLRDGLKPLVRTRKEIYRNIVTAIARQIVDLITSKVSPPVVDELCWLDSRDDSFWEENSSPPLDWTSATKAIFETKAKELGPNHILILSIVHEPTVSTDPKIDFIYQHAIGDGYVVTPIYCDYNDDDFEVTLISVMETAKKANWIVVVVLAPKVLANWDSSPAKTALHSDWIGGLLLLAESESVRVTEIRSAMYSSGDGRLCVREFIGDDLYRFDTEFFRIINDVRQKILLSGQVFRKRPENDGPDQRPILANTTEPERA
jgi:hypothetical protein